ncbi:MAG: addiction module antidote protein [Candidatus Rifleibacteriota bacterium]
MTSNNKLSETDTSLDAVHLKNSEEKAVYLESCLLSAETDAFVIAQALGEIARAVGMTKIAKETGLSRENLYQALSGERNPTLETFLKVLKAVNLKLRIEPVIPSPRSRKRKPIRRVYINDTDIRFSPITRNKYDELARKSHHFLPDNRFAASLRKFLDDHHPEFDAPRLYAALKNNFGESASGYDSEECSFEYCFLLKIKVQNKTTNYLLRFNDKKHDFGIVFSRLGSPKHSQKNNQDLIGEALSEETKRQFVIWLVSFLRGYMSVCEKIYKQEFARSHKFLNLIYGFKNGSFFARYYDEKGFAEACAAMAASKIPFNIIGVGPE